MYERIWGVDAEFVGDDFDRLCESLRQLATDSAKSRTKRDRKQQRGTFREILRTFEVSAPVRGRLRRTGP